MIENKNRNMELVSKRVMKMIEEKYKLLGFKHIQHYNLDKGHNQKVEEVIYDMMTTFKNSPFDAGASWV